jgi:hypothetical protein
MSGFGSQGSRLLAVVAVLLFSGSAQAESRFQQIADEAALAAVQVLASGGLPADAVAVAEQMVAVIPGAAAQVSASPADLSVTVKLSAQEAKAPAVSTARYLPPDQPANWAWASRQRFAVKAAPVVVGSYCLRDCEPPR